VFSALKMKCFLNYSSIKIIGLLNTAPEPLLHHEYIELLFCEVFWPAFLNVAVSLSGAPHLHTYCSISQQSNRFSNGAVICFPLWCRWFYACGFLWFVMYQHMPDLLFSFLITDQFWLCFLLLPFAKHPNLPFVLFPC